MLEAKDIRIGDIFCEWYKRKPFSYLKIVETGTRYFKYQTCRQNGEINDKTKRRISVATLNRYKPVN